jgi:hypothetical protein
VRHADTWCCPGARRRLWGQWWRRSWGPIPSGIGGYTWGMDEKTRIRLTKYSQKAG